jgi:DNA-directed RNA polymerase subunit RPC12/RpoP
MPVYICPECSTKLKRAEPLPAGKKLRCPECAKVFAPPAAPAKAKTEDPRRKGAPDAPAIEPERKEDIFGFKDTDYDPDTDQAREDVFRPIKDRFDRSARGPALIQVVRPSDWLLRNGAAICISAVLGIGVAIWPLVFKTEDVQPPDKSGRFQAYAKQGERRFKELTEEEWNMRWVYLGCFIGQFLWGSGVCLGASKMHTLTSYPMSIVGTIMGAVGPGVPWAIIYILLDAINDGDGQMIFVSIILLTMPGVPIAMWCLATLRRKDVIEGFKEEQPEEYVGDRAVVHD